MKKMQEHVTWDDYGDFQQAYVGDYGLRVETEGTWEVWGGTWEIWGETDLLDSGKAATLEDAKREAEQKARGM